MFAMAQNEIPRRWLLWASGLLLMVAGCVEPPATVPAAAPPIASGQARVWFYRPWEPSESLNLALIDMNDSYVGAVETAEPSIATSHRGIITSRQRASVETPTRTETSTSPPASSCT
jgi:hypothetical protein